MVDQLVDAGTRPTPRQRPARWPGWARGVVGLVVVAVGVAIIALVLPSLDRNEFSRVTLGGPVERLEVEIARGDVELVPSGNGDLVVERTTRWRVRRPDVDAEMSGTTAHISADCPPPALLTGCWSSHRIEVPSGVLVDVHTGSGSVAIRGLDGAVQVVTSNGRVDGSGLLVAEFVADTGGGDVFVEFDESPSRIDVTSGGGDVDLVVPGGPYEIQARADGGDVSIEVDSEKLAERMIVVRSGGGHITIRAPDS